MTETYLAPHYIRNKSDLLNCVEIGTTSESIVLDFKREIETKENSQGKGKKSNSEELALDICQFTNTWGGTLIVGVDEQRDPENNRKIASSFTNVDNFEEISRYIHDSVLSIIYPSLIKIEIIPIRIESNVEIISINVLPLSSMLYPQVARPSTEEGCEHINFQVEAISCNRRSPRQMVLTPGSPSPFRPKNPPNWAIHLIA